MAHMNQERKKELSPAIKAVLKKYKMKGYIGVDNHSTLVVNIKSGQLDILKNAIECKIRESWRDATWRDGDEKEVLTNLQVNHYHIENGHSGKCKEFLIALRDAMMTGNHDRSDIMTDYFDVGWYIDINIGKWNKPYICA